jgi:hypothetical protein
VYKNDRSSYKWHELTICIRWNADHGEVLCIGTDAEFEHLFFDCLTQMWKSLPPSNPLSMLVITVEAIVALQDLAVWLIRDIVRDVEKVC